MRAQHKKSTRILSLVLVFCVSFCSCASTNEPYRLGNFASPPTKTAQPVPVKTVLQHVLQAWNQCARYFRMYVFMYYTKDSIESITEDCWLAVRDPDRVFGQQITKKGERQVVMKRTKRSETLRSLVGAGYTPRLVWLFGLMLRGIVHCTALPTVFEPPIGFGAGAVAAARFAHREWLPCIMLGWYGSEFYWKWIFGVNGPPSSNGFDGVPIKIRHVQL